MPLLAIIISLIVIGACGQQDPRIAQCALNYERVHHTGRDRALEYCEAFFGEK